MRSSRIWSRLLGVDKTVIEGVEVEESGAVENDPGDVVIVVHARPARGRRLRCGVCERRCGKYDNGEGGDAGGTFNPAWFESAYSRYPRHRWALAPRWSCAGRRLRDGRRRAEARRPISIRATDVGSVGPCRRGSVVCDCATLFRRG